MSIESGGNDQKSIGHIEKIKTGIFVNATAHKQMGTFFDSSGKQVNAFSPDFITRNPGSENQADPNDEYLELNPDQINRIYGNLVDHLEQAKISPESFLFRLDRLIKYLETIENENTKLIIKELNLVLESVKNIASDTEKYKKAVLEKMERKESTSEELRELDLLKEQTKKLDLSPLKEKRIF